MRRIEDHTIQDTVNGIYSQVEKSIDYAASLGMPADPIDLYYWLKSRTRYKNDKRGVEQIQKLETLLENNIHGIPGAGDCDCFTVAVLAGLAAAGYDKAYIVLIGNNSSAPTHVYPAVEYMGQKFALDLTAEGPGIHRSENASGAYRKFQPITIYFPESTISSRMALELHDRHNPRRLPIPGRSAEPVSDIFSTALSIFQANPLATQVAGQIGLSYLGVPGFAPTGQAPPDQGYYMPPPARPDYMPFILGGVGVLALILIAKK